jgi:pimeloyl-ACP methyl ester carboxylesterase
MDDAGIEVATVMGWSMGVNTMFELAVRHPERVNGLFAVAGVPGDTFRTMLAPFHLPHPVARALTVGVARTLRRIGRVISPISTRLPVGPTTIFLISHSGFMFPVADPTMAARAIKEFLSTPLDWYMHLGLRTSEHARVSLRSIKVPTMFVAGRWDVLAGARDMATAAARIEGATYVELNGSHFIAMEQPERVHDLLLELLEQVG